MSLLSFPLTRGEFMDRLRVAGRNFDLDEALEITELGNGDVISADFGPRLWRGKVQLSQMTYAEAEAIKARISALQYAARDFRAYDPLNRFPQDDPEGTQISGSTPVVLEVDADTRRLKLDGLPAGYTLKSGDRLSLTAAGSGDVALFQVVDDEVVAFAGGNTAKFEVVPHIPPVFAAGDAVELVRPYCLAKIVPGSFQPGRATKTHILNMSFEFVQKLG